MVPIVLYFLALEGLVNFIYEWSEVPHNEWRRWSVRKKWMNVAKECRPHIGIAANVAEGVADDSQLFSRFLELKDGRSLIAHSEAIFRLLRVDIAAQNVHQEKGRNSTRDALGRLAAG